MSKTFSIGFGRYMATIYIRPLAAAVPVIAVRLSGARYRFAGRQLAPDFRRRRADWALSIMPLHI